MARSQEVREEGDPVTRQEMLDFVRKSPTSFMGTVEKGEPRVRGMDTPLVDENGLTFLTGCVKDVCRQLLADPSVELCYVDMENGTQLRLRGRMEHLEDEEIKKQIVNTRFTFLKPVAEKHGWGAFAVFRLRGGTARVWSAKNPAGGSEVFEF
ncbi:pyridoxamine 5'-phosphate oxidase family protein [Candidatus Fermentibacterales bacterium]|nr:pyridoxamine 5'-phosphate oxidase family protein [Candidatus Fermentibacterales bacterium]